MWCADSGKLLFTGSHHHSARSCALNTDGTMVAVGHDDCSLKVNDSSIVAFTTHYTRVCLENVFTGSDILCGRERQTTSDKSQQLGRGVDG